VTALNGDVYASFDHLITESNAIPDERFQRFISILKGEKLNATNAQLKRDREKLLNQKELEVSGLLALPMLRMRYNRRFVLIDFYNLTFSTFFTSVDCALAISNT